LDLGTTLAFLEADAQWVRCRGHGVVVCAVPWARHGSRFTRAFEDQTAWLAVNTSKSAVAELMRVAWRAVGAICDRVCDDARREFDLLHGLHRIGIDEISHRKGQRYLTVVVDHDTGTGSPQPSRAPGSMWISVSSPGRGRPPAAGEI